MIENIATAVIFNLDHCISLFPLGFCRLLFNKPILQLNDLLLRLISFISTENLFTILSSPFRQILTISIYALAVLVLYLVLRRKLKTDFIIVEKKFFILIFLITIIIGIFTRFYGLDVVPSGFTIDEVSIGYNSFTINKTGKDQYGNFLPITHFESLGDF